MKVETERSDYRRTEEIIQNLDEILSIVSRDSPRSFRRRPEMIVGKIARFIGLTLYADASGCQSVSLPSPPPYAVRGPHSSLGAPPTLRLSTRARGQDRRAVRPRRSPPGLRSLVWTIRFCINYP